MCKYARMQRKYAYRRKLPHYQWIGKTYFITFSTRNREVLPAHARDLILETCLTGNGKQYQLEAVVVMPDHVHLVLTPLEDENGAISLRKYCRKLKVYRRIASINIWDAREAGGSRNRLIVQCGRWRTHVENWSTCWHPVRAGLVNNPYDYRCLWTASTGEGARASKLTP